MPWLLNFLYTSLILLALPWLAIRRVRTGKSVAGWREKFTGRTPDLDHCSNRVWLHAVSVGEVLLLRRIVAELQYRHPATELVITTTTATGFDVARKEFSEHTVCFFPFDFSWAVRRAIRRLKPTAILLAELELWPNLLLAAGAKNIPVGVINGRLSEKSFRGYSKIKPIVAYFLKYVAGIAAQNEEYAGRFRALGCRAERVVVTGSVKYDGLESNRDNPRTRELRAAFGIAENDLILIAGSTQSPEEAIALRAWKQLSSEHPNLRLILVPRHRERFEEVAGLVQAENLPLCRRSIGVLPDSRFPIPDSRFPNLHGRSHGISPDVATRPILLLDTLGELAACWGMADIAFVGGSLTSRGGQNMIEPAAYGAALLVGPHTHNFRETVEILTQADAIEIIRNEQHFAEIIKSLIQNEFLRRAMGDRARETVQKHRGATEKTLDFLKNEFLRRSTRRSNAA